MKYIVTALLAALLSLPASAQEAEAAEEPEMTTEPQDATELELDDFRWIARPVVVFADSPLDPLYQQQMELLARRPEALIERDVVVLTDTDPEAQSEIRTRLRPRGFMLVIIGKDGQVKLRKPRPWDVREISRSIDKMPLRQQELRDQRRTDG